MLNKIIRFSLNNRLLVLICSILLMIGGVYTAYNMEVDVFPDLNAPTVVVMTEANGMAPEEVERLVTFPLETAVNGATDVRRVRSSSTTGFSVVWVEFNWGTDIYRARQIVSEKIATIQDRLPKNIGTPTLGPQSSILGELMFVSLTADSTSMQELRTLADWRIRPRLLATGGVAQVAVLGGEIKEYQILLDPDKMKHYGVGLNEVYQSVQEMNRNVSGGILYEYGNEYIVRGVISTDCIESLSKVLVKKVGDTPIYLGSVAEVKVGNSFPKMGEASYNGKSSVIMTVTKQPNTGTIDLTKELDLALADVSKTLPADVKLNTDIYRQSRFIESSINNVKKSLWEGGIFVVIVLFLFLMNTRTTVISLVAIPLSLVSSILALKLMGLTINTMSLGGMCIAIGSLVDDAIVDVENVFKRLRENRQLPEGERRKVRDVIFEASREVRMPILNSTLIIIASFMPLFFLTGMEGRMLVPLGIAFIVALCSSTVVALTVTPVLCSYLLGKDKKRSDGSPEREPLVSRRLKDVYLRALDRALSHRRMVLWSTGGALVVALVLFFTLGRSFLPPFNEGSFTINVSTLPGISLEESNRIGQRAEEALLSIPEIKVVGRKTGRAELDEHALGVNTSEIEAPFELDRRSKEEVIEEVRHKLKEIPGVNIEVGAPITHRIDAMLSGTRAGIAIKLFGSDLNRMYTLGNQIKEAIADIDGIADLNVEQQVERPQLKIEPKRDMLGKYGITMPEFAEMVSVLLAGEAVSQVYEGDQAFDLVLKVGEESRTTADRIREMSVDAGGVKVPFGNIADVRSAMGPNTINRENVSRKIVISANVAGRDLRGVVNDIQERVDDKVKLPEGYHIEYGGQFESEQSASRTLMIASIFAIMVIFLLLYNQFRSSVQSAVVLINLPLALIGGVLAIRLTNGVVSIPAIIGFISLFGIATRNGMLLISRYNDLRREGYSVMESIKKGSTDRLNPILMTALTSALALIPMVIGGDLPGNEIQSPMAKVILGGLFTSTLLNGFVIPVMYLIISRRSEVQPETNDNEINDKEL
ncbi:MAG: efflux RND transporter permease subunit [Lepagella sp.]